MVKFYKLSRMHGKPGIGFLQEKGYFLPNNYLLDLVVYKSDETDNNGRNRWFVVETSSGCALGQGESRQKAIQNFENNVERMGIESIGEAIVRSKNKYGITPDHRPQEVF